MPTSLESYAGRIVAAALPIDKISLGPWRGYMASRPSDLVPLAYVTDTDQSPDVTSTPCHDMNYIPRTGSWKRRSGQTQKFDTFGSAVGHLPAKWGGKGRQLEEFVSDSFSDGYPSMCSLVTKETMASGSVLDDGRFSNLWVRDQVNSLNYTVGDEFSVSTTYPVPGTTQSYKFVPLWYDSGDGGITRGNTEFARRFFFSGSRSMAKVGNWRYFPSFRGTPSRWRERFTDADAVLAVPNADGNAFANTWQQIGASTWYQCVNTSDGTTSYASRSEVSGSYNFEVVLSAIPPTASSYTINYVARRTGAVNAATTVQFSVAGADGIFRLSPAITIQSAWTTSMDPYTAVCTTAGASGQTPGAVKVSCVCAASGGNRADVTYISFGLGSSSIADNRLIPSGPIPPTHAGSLAKGTDTTAIVTTVRPTADRDDGTFTNEAGNNTNLYESINDETDEDANYIRTAVATDDTCDIDLEAWGITPASDDTVTIYFRARRTRTIGTPTGDLNMKLMEVVGGTPTERSGSQQTLTTSFQTFSWTMTSGEISAVSSWANTFCLRFDCTGLSANEIIWASRAYATHQATGATAGGWKGSDRFYWGVAYVFEDDSVWMPTFGRAPNSSLESGLNLFTVDASNPTHNFDKLIWSNIPVGPYGVKKIRLLRTDKIDSTSDDTLQLSPLNLRVVDDVDNGTTTYDDYKADDDALQLDPDGLLLRIDHIMPPRARNIFAGDMRVCHSYGGQNPAAITIAPVGISADYDLNVADTSSTAFGSTGMYMRIAADTSDVRTLTLVKGNETDTETFTLTSLTLQELVDSINALTVAANGQQWRAQLCPGVTPETAATYLLPHTRSIASCVVSGQTITLSSGALANVAVGSLISGTGVTQGAYVTSIDSTTQLTFSGTITAATKTLTFYFDLGDNGDSNLANEGYQRVIANSLPGFLYFSKTYLNLQPVEKSSIWMTTASPASTKSAPNCFSGLLTNKFFPPTANAGVAQGGVGIDNGFFVPFANKRAVIKNTRDNGTGFDADYRLFITNENSGCVSWSSVFSGSGFGGCVGPEGVIAADLDREILLSDDVWQPPSSDALTGRGIFSYEIPQSVASTAADTDNQYLRCKIMGGKLYVGYRTSASTTHPNRLIAFDFSCDNENHGLKALFRDKPLTGPHGVVAPAGTLYGWGTPAVRSVTALGGGRRSDGFHLYGWNDANAGSTGDGRIDELETSDTDNGTAITAALNSPWIAYGNDWIAGQKIVAWHNAASGVTAAMDYHRTYTDTTTYSGTVTTTSDPVYRDAFELPMQGARVQAEACYIGWRQSVGAAAELHALELHAKRVKRLGI